MREERELIKLDFNVTNRCNFRCLHCCFASGEWNLGEMPYDKIESILNEFVGLGGRRIDITGGEPLVRNDTSRIIKLAKKLSIKTELVTNASLLNEEMLFSFRQMGLDAIAVSLDGPTAKVYNHIRRKDEKTFKKVLKNIKKSAEFGFYTKVNTVVFSSNLKFLSDTTRLAIDLGAKEHGFYYFSPIGRGKINYAEVARPLGWLEIIRTKLWPLRGKIKFSLETPVIETKIAEKRKLSIGCFMQNPWHLQILPHGNIYPCAIMSSYNLPIGNLWQKSLSELWQSDDLRNGVYYEKNIAPLVKKFSACVDYPSFSQLIRSGRYKFVCLCTKFTIEELML